MSRSVWHKCQTTTQFIICEGNKYPTICVVCCLMTLGAPWRNIWIQIIAPNQMQTAGLLFHSVIKYLKFIPTRFFLQNSHNIFVFDSIFYFVANFDKKLLLVRQVNAPVPLRHGWPTINRLDGEFKFSRRPVTMADFKNFSVDSNDICCSGDAEASMPTRLNGLNVPSNVM